jgi:tetratricopeptide (TPR) repeat protein
MKRLGFTIVLCLITAVSFGQKKAVSEALKLAKDATKPNFADARTKIKGALENAETKDDAKTWFTAGQIEDLQFTAETNKLILGQAPDEATMYTALSAIYPYFLKTYELDKLPDAKGKVKPKYTKEMAGILKANLMYYMNGAIYFHEKQDFKKAYDFFEQYVAISDGNILKEGIKPPKAGEVVPIDSNYLYSIYYAAVTSATLGEPATAIKALTRASKQDFHKNEVMQFLADEYQKAGDSIGYENALTDGLAVFPTEDFFLLNLITIYINTERYEKALNFMQTAIANDPNNAQLYSVSGHIYEIGLKDITKAEESLLKAVELESENAKYQAQLGTIYFNQGVAIIEIANEISDMKKYKEESDKAKELFRKSLPYFEKAYQLDPEAATNKMVLRSIYYNLDMGEKLEALEKAMGGSDENN